MGIVILSWIASIEMISPQNMANLHLMLIEKCPNKQPNYLQLHSTVIQSHIEPILLNIPFPGFGNHLSLPLLEAKLSLLRTLWEDACGSGDDVARLCLRRGGLRLRCRLGLRRVRSHTLQEVRYCNVYATCWCCWEEIESISYW